MISRTPDGKPERLISIMADVTARKRMEAREQALMREVAHRSVNLMSIVQSIARQIGRRAGSLAQFQEELQSRLQSLAKSQEEILRSSGAGATLDEVVRAQLRAFVDEADPALRVEGPRLNLSFQAAHALGLAIHELATNASKHGAWSVPAGVVTVAWRLARKPGETARLVFVWTELGFAPAPPSGRKGFGHVVLYDLIPRSLNASAEGELLKEGFRWTLTAPLAALEASP